MADIADERQGLDSDVSDLTSAAFKHVLVDTDRGVSECTIFPRGCDDHAIRTHWLTASGESFVSLENVR